MFFKIGALKIFAVFIEEHLRWSLFLKKLHVFKPATLLEIDSTQMFSCKFAKFLKNPFFTEHLRLPLL